MIYKLENIFAHKLIDIDVSKCLIICNYWFKNINGSRFFIVIIDKKWIADNYIKNHGCIPANYQQQKLKQDIHKGKFTFDETKRRFNVL